VGHINLVFSVLCGLASLIASLYAIQVSRAELKLKRKQLADTDKPRDFGTVASVVAALFVLAVLCVGCASSGKPIQPNAFDRTLFNIETNLTPAVSVQTNTVVVTNAVTVTNDAGVVTWQTNVVLATNVCHVTNFIPQYELAPKEAAETAIKATGGVVGGLFGFGGLAATLLGGVYHTYMQIRNRRINAALTQAIETGREVLKSTPQGQQLDAAYVQWLQQHQTQAGVINAVAGMVNSFVDNDAAKAAAQLISRN
jgi:hypothetical protein